MNEPKQWHWCIRCERAFQADYSGSFPVCIYQKCTGLEGDIWDWEIIRELNPSYPEMPLSDQLYPLNYDLYVHTLNPLR